MPIFDAPVGQVVGVMELYKVPVQLNEAIRERADPALAGLRG
jgi:hypothetical protein